MSIHMASGEKSDLNNMNAGDIWAKDAAILGFVQRVNGTFGRVLQIDFYFTLLAMFRCPYFEH